MAGRIVFTIALVLLAFSCSNPESGSLEWPALKVFSSLSSINSDRVDIVVRLEGGDGDCPTGARVQLVSPANVVSWLSFSAEQNYYEGQLFNPVSGTYRIRVNSVLGDLEQQIFYQSLTDEPLLVSLMDGSGNNTLTGDDLDSTELINLNWEPVNQATVYQGSLYKGSQRVLIFSSLDNSYLLEPETLDSSGVYSLQIKAQYIEGDPYLIERNYYAFSSSESPIYYFSTL